MDLSLKFKADLDQEVLIKKINIMVTELKKSLGNFGSGVKILDEQSISSQFNKIDKEFTKVGQSATRTKQFINGMAQEVDNAAKSGSMFGKAFMFTQVTQAVSQVTQALQVVAKAGIEYESSLQAVGAITGLAGAPLDALGQSARNLAKEFGGSASSQLESFQGILSKMGPSVANTPEALALLAKNVNILSAASGDDAATSMNAIVDAMLQFGLVTGDAMTDAETSTKIINGLAASAGVGAAEIPQVAQAILQAGVAAKGSNQSFEQMNAAIQVLAVGGKTGSEAGVALRNVMGLLQKASGPAEASLRSMGLSSKELGEILNKEGLNQAMIRLKQGMSSFGTEAEKNAALMNIFGMENASAAGILMDNTDAYDEFLKGIIAGQEGTGAAFEQASQRMDTAGTQMEIWKAKINDAFIGLSQAMGQGLTAVVGFAGEMAPLVSTFTGLGAIIPIDMIKSFGKQILTLIPGFTALGTAGAASGVATSTAWVTVLAPIAAIAGALAGLYLFFTKTERGVEIAKKLGEGFEKLWDSAAPAIDGLKNYGTALFNTIISIGEAVYEWLIAPFEIGIEVIVAVVSAISNLITGGNDSINVFEMLGSVYNHAAKAVTAVGNAFEFATEWIKKSKATIISFIQNAPELFGVIFEYAKYYLNPVNWVSGDEDFEKALSSKMQNVIKKIQDSANSSLSIKKTMDDSKESIKQVGKEQVKTNKVIESGVTASSKMKKNAESELEIAKKKFDLEKKNIANNLQSYEINAETTRLQEGRAKSLIDEIALQNEKNKALVDEKNKFLDIYKIKLNDKGEIVDIGVSIGKDKNKSEIIADLNNQLVTLTNEISKNDNISIELKGKINISQKELNDKLKELERQQLRYDIEFGLKKPEDLVSALEIDFAVIQEKVTEQQQKLNESLAKLKASKGGEQDDALDFEIIQLQTKLAELRKIEIEKLTEIELEKKAIRDKSLEDLKELHEKEIEEIEKKAIAEAKLTDLALKMVSSGLANQASQEKDSRLSILESQKEAEIITEIEYNNSKKQIEADYQSQILVIQEAQRGTELEAERRHTLMLLKEKRNRLLAERELLDPVKDKDEYENLSQQLSDFEAQIRDKGDLIKSYSEELQGNMTEIFSNLLGGDNEALQNSAKKMFALVGGILKKAASATATKLILDQLMFTPGGIGALIAAPLITALVNAAISKILDPILSSLTSFSTGGRIDEPTLAIVGDAKKAGRGSNMEWIFRDDQLGVVMSIVLAKYTSQLKSAMIPLADEITRSLENRQLSSLSVNEFGEIVKNNKINYVHFDKSLNSLNRTIEALPENLKNSLDVSDIIKISIKSVEIDALGDNYKKGKIDEDTYFVQLGEKQKKIKSYASGSGFLYHPEQAIVGDAGVDNPELVLNSPQLAEIINRTAQTANNSVVQEMRDLKILMKQFIDKDNDIYLDSAKVTDEVIREMNRRKIKY